jgi:fibronectin type 3 domain-containing protein
MVGWNTPHLQGMSAKREPEGFGTWEGYNDVSSEAAGWVFNSPLQVLITEISDDSGATFASIELYNPIYSTIDFGAANYTFENSGGTPLVGSWVIPTADEGQHALFNLTAAALDSESDIIKLYQNGYLVESIPYGTYGIVPDPLPNESAQRYFDGAEYTDLWGRNWTTGPNFGAQNNIPAPNLVSPIKLNEVMFYPDISSDGFVEVIYRLGNPMNITGYKIVCDKVFDIPYTILDGDLRYYYLFEFLDQEFFSEMQSTGDNVYLYDDNGSFLDMVGWSSQHTQGKTVTRVPNGNGTRDGFDDVSSVAAGWQFDSTHTVDLIDIEMRGNEKSLKYGNLTEHIIFNLTITNHQATSDVINILNSTLVGWEVEIYNETQTEKISQIFIEAYSMDNITVKITLPDSIPFIAFDNVTVEIISTNNNLISDQILLYPRVLPFIHPKKTITPSEIYVQGSGHDENATITLNLTGLGMPMESRQPQDMIFCTDTSGSMTQTAIDFIKEWLKGYVDEMEIPDQGAMVHYNSSATLMNPLTENYTQLKNDIDNIPGPMGGTDMADALNKAITELNTTTGNGDPSHLRVIIFLSDGENNAGDPPVIAAAQDAADDGIKIYTVGLEPLMGFLNEDLLKEIANITGGKYYYAPTIDELPDIYFDISGFLLTLAGRDPNVFDNEPMIRDVIPPWIKIIPGSFSIPPNTMYVNETGYTFLEWNKSSLQIGDTWSVSFNITSSMAGYVEANNLTASRIWYVDNQDSIVQKLFPLTMINVIEGITVPDVPLNLIATPGVDFINLTWNAPVSDGGDPIINYRIYRGTSPGSVSFYMEIGNITTFNDTNVISGVTYYYQISAVNSIGEGPLSNEVNATPYTVPSLPVNLGADAGDGFVNLSWSAPASDGGTPVTGYYIYRNGTVGAYAFVPAGQFWFNDTNVANGLNYTYNVSAVNEVGEGPNATITAMPLSLTLPSVCLNLEALAGDGYIILTWDAPVSEGGGPIINYWIYKGTAPDSETFYIEIGNITTYNDTSVTAGITYYYKVSAVNINGEGPLSNEASATPPTVPFAPLNLIATGEIGYIELSWNVPTSDGGAPITNYRIYRGTSPGSETFYDITGNVTTFMDMGVTPGVTYYYRVSAVNIVGEGPLSNEAFATPPAVPSEPLNLTAIAGNGYIVLSWDEPASDNGYPITDYRIYKGTVSGGETFYVTIGNVTTYNDTSVIAGITYYYKVSAVNSYGEGPLSNEVFATPPNVPFAPLNLVADAGNDYIVLTWDEPTSDGGSPIINYSIYKGTSSGLETFYLSIGNLTSYNDSDVSPGITYYYRVSALNIVGEGPLSNEAYATPPTVPSIPLNLTAKSGDSFVNLTWDVPSSDGGIPIIEYHIYRDDTTGIYDSVGSDQLWYNDTNVFNGMTYTYNVSAVNEVGEGPNATVTATPMPPIIPGPPMGLMASPGDGQINVSWEPPSDGSESEITSYNIYRIGIPDIYASVTSHQLWFIDYNVTPGTIYSYQITAESEYGEGAQSSGTDIKAGAAPSSPTNLTATPGDSYVNVTWDAPLSDGGYQIDNYTIYRGVISGQEVFLVIIGNETLFNDTGVENDITYYYKIIAVNSIGESPVSESADATPFTVNRPPTVTIISPSEGSIIKDTFEILGTAGDNDGTIHRVEIKIDNENWVRAEGTTSWSYEWDTTSLPDGMYTITARAFDGVQYSQEINITIEVNNPEEKTQPSEEPWIWVLIIIVAIVLVLVFVIWFFRKKEPQDMPDDKMFEIIKQKFEDGKISRETFEDFKKRYNKD